MDGYKVIEVLYEPMTLRDDVWDEVLTTLTNRGAFKISDLPFQEKQRHTVRRVLREMEEMGWLRRESPQAAFWRIGSKAELLLNIDEEVLEEARS